MARGITCKGGGARGAILPRGARVVEPPGPPCYDPPSPQEKLMNEPQLLNRRALLGAAGAGVAAALATSTRADTSPKAGGRIKQSVCRWCYGGIKLEKLAEEARKMGYQSIELLTIDEYKVVKPFGLTCAMLGRVSISDGLNRKEFHEGIEKHLRTHIEFAASEGLPNVICMAGNRRGMADDEGLANCALGLKRILAFAEEKKVNVCMEGLNSRVDHKDYMYDRTAWGVELCKKLGSPRFKLLYDIYHMQIMEGDVIRTIRDNKEYLAHFHTGGNPGRHEIDDSQELNYPAIVRAIVETGYQGFLGQEFIPVRDPLASLAQGFRICDV
jgi:hydroxypyruvate isomerase